MAKSILERVEAKDAERRRSQAAAIDQGENGLTLVDDPEILPSLMDGPPLVW